jgi:hypothetical protein
MTEESHPKLDYTEGVPVPTFHGIQEAFHRLKLVPFHHEFCQRQLDEPLLMH